MCKRIFAHQTSETEEIPFYKIGTLGNTADTFISRELFNNYKEKYNYPVKGEVMITCAGTVGKCIVFDGKDSYYQDSNIVWISNSEKIIENQFIFHILSCTDWAKLNSTTITRIYNDNLRSLEILYPPKTEQAKIASFLTLIDELIATQMKIIEGLEKMVEGLCRFLIHSKFSNKKLKDCVTCYSSSLTETEALSEDGIYPVYGATGIISYIPTYQTDDKAILIIKDGSGIGKVQFAESKFSVIGTLNYLISSKDINLKYIFYCLRHFNFQKYKVGSGIPHIYFKDYGESSIYCPSLQEQNRIEKIISKFDEKLNLEKSLLTLYQQQKKYLLQNLFV